ncbi:MAG: right-handed parallel beta-helix repeat-containing protein, partial [Flavobacteriaceae bacterium]
MTIKLPSTKIVLLLTALSVLAFGKIEASQVKASSFGYNSSDATDALKAAFRSNYDTVIVDYKAAGWNVGPITLFDIKNKVIIFEPGVVLRAITGRFNARNAKLLKLARPLNLTILGYGAKFKMNKAEYTNLDPNTEYRVSFEIQHGVNVTVKGLTLEESGGDGVYLSGNTSKNIVLEDLNVINQSRSGITIISADGLLVKNCDFSGTSGPIVGSGIKFEPHGIDDKFIDVRFEDCRAFDNGQAGITFGLNHMTSATAPLDVVFKDCYLSNNSIESRRNPNTEIMLSNGTTNYFAPVGGKIRFENLVVENVRKSVFKTRKVYNAVKAEFVNCSFKVKPGSLAAPIAMETPNYRINVPHLGGVSFANTSLEYSNAGPFLAIYGSPTMAGLRDVTGDFLITNPNITEDDAILYTRVNSYINVNINFDILSAPPPPPPPPGGGSDCSNTLNITANETSAGIREAAQTLTASNAILHSSGTVTYKAGDKVTLK